MYFVSDFPELLYKLYGVLFRIVLRGQTLAWVATRVVGLRAGRLGDARAQARMVTMETGSSLTH